LLDFLVAMHWLAMGIAAKAHRAAHRIGQLRAAGFAVSQFALAFARLLLAAHRCAAH
jgi:hypothetical protein